MNNALENFDFMQQRKVADLTAELHVLRAANADLREACQTMIDWDHAEKNAPPYASDGGAHWRMRLALCEKAFDQARAALKVKP